jgi:hypothetical protein
MSFLVNEYANSTSFWSEFISIFHESKFEPLLTFGLPPNVVTPAIKGVEDASSIGIVCYLFYCIDSQLLITIP